MTQTMTIDTSLYFDMPDLNPAIEAYAHYRLAIHHNAPEATRTRTRDAWKAACEPLEPRDIEAVQLMLEIGDINNISTDQGRERYQYLNRTLNTLYAV